MDNDDRLVGRILSRREVLQLFGAVAGVFILDACAPAGTPSPQPASVATQAGTTTPAQAGTTAPARAATAVPTQAATASQTAPTGAAVIPTPSCVVKPALTEGPYFVDEKLNRSDIRSDPSDNSVKPGAQLDITLRVYQIGANGCTPLAGAQVDVWHCDALGVYSDASDPGFNTKGKKFLRGYQTTDAGGTVKFTTIYHGWYQGRAVHVHFKIRTNPTSGAGKEFTSQWFFDETLTDQVHAQQPYAAKGQGRLKNSGDSIYRESNGQTILNVVKSAQGYTALFDIGLQMS